MPHRSPHAAHQWAYLQLFLGAVAISDCEVDNPVEARMDGHPGLADLTARDESRDEPQLGS